MLTAVLRPCWVMQVMLYDDEQGDCITPEDVFERLDDDLAVAGAVVWVGISFEQSASTEYFRKASVGARARAGVCAGVGLSLSRVCQVVAQGACLHLSYGWLPMDPSCGLCTGDCDALVALTFTGCVCCCVPACVPACVAAACRCVTCWPAMGGCTRSRRSL